MKQSIEDLRRQLTNAEARAYDSDWIVRMQGRKDVEALKKRIARREREAVSKEAVRVVFRVDSEGNVFALLPDEKATLDGLCVCYQHVGQHGAAAYAECIHTSRPATPEEYAPLKEEMEKMGYRLKAIKRRSR